MSISELYRSFSKAIPLVEENDERCSRPIFLKHCSVEFNPSNKNSWRKSFLSKATRPFRHWALEIGNYSYDLRVGERQMSRYVVSQIPNSEAARAFEFNVRVLWHEHGKWTVRKGCKEGKAVQIGSTTMTDLEINEIARQITRAMNLQGGFDRIWNNCQVFSKAFARRIDPTSGKFDKFRDTSRTMKKLKGITRDIALVTGDLLHEVRIEEMPKKIERWADEDLHTDSEVAKLFLDAVIKIGAEVELIDEADERWRTCNLEAPEFLAKHFERIGIYNFSDAQTKALIRDRQIYGAGYMRQQPGVSAGTTSSSWQPAMPTVSRPVLDHQLLYSEHKTSEDGGRNL